MIGVLSDLLKVSSTPHQKIKHSHALVCWTGPGGQCLGACLQTGPKTLAKQKIFYLVNQGVIEFITPTKEQRSTMAGNVCLSEYALDACECVMVFGGTV